MEQLVPCSNNIYSNNRFQNWGSVKQCRALFMRALSSKGFFCIRWLWSLPQNFYFHSKINSAWALDLFPLFGSNNQSTNTLFGNMHVIFQVCLQPFPQNLVSIEGSYANVRLICRVHFQYKVLTLMFRYTFTSYTINHRRLLASNEKNHNMKKLELQGMDLFYAK